MRYCEALRGVAGSQWSDWRWQLRHRLQRAEDLTTFFAGATSADVTALAAYMASFKLAATPYTLSLVELGDDQRPRHDDPIWRQVRFLLGLSPDQVDIGIHSAFLMARNLSRCSILWYTDLDRDLARQLNLSTISDLDQLKQTLQVTGTPRSNQVLHWQRLVAAHRLREEKTQNSGSRMTMIPGRCEPDRV
jgi:hypothetical protein